MVAFPSLEYPSKILRNLSSNASPPARILRRCRRNILPHPIIPPGIILLQPPPHPLVPLPLLIPLPLADNPPRHPPPPHPSRQHLPRPRRPDHPPHQRRHRIIRELAQRQLRGKEIRGALIAERDALHPLRAAASAPGARGERDPPAVQAGHLIRPGGEAREDQARQAGGDVVPAADGEDAEEGAEEQGAEGAEGEGEEDEGGEFAGAPQAFEDAEGVEEDDGEEEVGRGGAGELEGEDAAELEVGPEVRGGADGEEVFGGEEGGEDAAGDVEEDEQASGGCVGETGC